MLNRLTISEFDKGNSCQPQSLYNRFDNEFLKIFNACFEENMDWSRDTLWNNLLKGTILIAEDESKKLIGFLLYQENKNGDFHIMTIAVDPIYQRNHQRVGSQLIEGLKLKAQQPKTKKKVVLECRPLNYPFYRKLGFKSRALINDYYCRITPTIPAVEMEYPCQLVSESTPKPASSISEDKKQEISKLTDLTPESKEYEVQRNLLKELASSVKASTSFWYGGYIASFFRSQRKEQAFGAIIRDLEAMGDPNTKTRKLNPTNLLQTIAYNAMIVRGFGVCTTETTSGRALVAMLNTPKYSTLKNLISPQKNQITYQDLRDFVGLGEEKLKSTVDVPYSPYRYF